jgi:hypothetical protein
MTFADEARRKTKAAQAKIPAPPPAPAPETPLEFHLKRIHAAISIATDTGDRKASYILYNVGDQYGVGWRAMVRPLPLVVSLIDDVFPLSYRGRHFSDPNNLLGEAQQIYSALAAEGFTISLSSCGWVISW